jgi:hypothetical protein
MTLVSEQVLVKPNALIYSRGFIQNLLLIYSRGFIQNLLCIFYVYIIFYDVLNFETILEI